jgi:hypothetical protein
MLNHQVVGSNLLENVRGVRQPSSKSDYDIICTEDYFEGILKDPQWCSAEVIDGGHPVRKSYVLKHPSGDVLEAEIAANGSVAKSLLRILAHNQVSNIDLAYTLKMSHRFLRNSPHFEKTWKDIRDLRKLGAKIPDCLNLWFFKREKETYYYNHPSLNKTKEDFFDTAGVTYIYDHDSIHEVLAIDAQPAYKSFLVGEVKTSKELFDSLDLNTKLNAVLEEAMVLAVERSLIHIDNPEEVAHNVWKYSLQKVCTSITSGWFREFAWEHYELCCKLYYSRVSGYYERFLIGKEQGIVKPFSGKKY